MKNTTERFEKAVTALYVAFYNNELNAFKCDACAVGNIVGHGLWQGFAFPRENPSDRNYLKVTPFLKMYPSNKDYSPDELQTIEYIFLKEWERARCSDGRNKEVQFKGLCAVIEYLCELDNIPNPMDYTKIFETEGGKPKYELEEVLS